MNRINYYECFEKPGNIVAIFGQSGSGKTTTLKHIINETKDTFTHIFIFQGSRPSKDNLYIDVVWPDDVTVVNADSDVKMVIETKKKEIDNIIQYITTLNTDIDDSNKKNKDGPQRKLMHLLLIFDDMTKLTNKFNDYLGKLRHSPVTMILLLHSCTNIDKTFRGFIDYYIIHTDFEIKLLADDFPKLKEGFNQLKLAIGDTKRVFYVFRPADGTSAHSLVSEDEVKKLKTPSVYKRSSKQRETLVRQLKELASKRIKEKVEVSLS